MRRTDISVDVTGAVGTGEVLEVATTVVVPGAGAVAPSVALVGFPGGGYSRRYYDLQIDGGYSQAEHHAAQGFAFICCDHLGVGDSSVPTTPLDYAAVARANAAAVGVVVERLRAGTLWDGGAAPIRTVIAMGQSYAGLVLTIGQASAASFDGVAFLGWSGIQALPPWPPDVDIAAMLSGRAGNGLDHPMRRVFHAPDVPDPIVLSDMTKRPGELGSDAPWSTGNLPGGPALADPARDPLGAGVVAAEAASITGPVFIGLGETDIVADAWAEPGAYRSSRDVTLCVFPAMGHMHNFASSRHALWDRLASWATTVAVAG